MRFFMHFWADGDSVFGQKTHSEKRKFWCPFVFIFVAAHGSLYGAIFRPKLRHLGGVTATWNLAGTQGWVKFSSRWAKMAHFGSSCPILKLKMRQDGLFWAPKIKENRFSDRFYNQRWPILASEINEKSICSSQLWMKI